MYFLEQLKFSHFEDSITYTLIVLSVFLCSTKWPGKKQFNIVYAIHKKMSENSWS